MGVCLLCADENILLFSYKGGAHLYHRRVGGAYKGSLLYRKLEHIKDVIMTHLIADEFVIPQTYMTCDTCQGH